MPTVLLHVVRGLTLIEAKFSAPGGSHYVNPYNLGIELNFLMTFGKAGNGLRWLLPLPKEEFTLPEYQEGIMGLTYYPIDAGYS